MAIDWSSPDSAGNGITGMLPLNFGVSDSVDSAGPAVPSSPASSYDLSTGLLSAFNTAANVYGKVAVADIQANARYPQFGMSYPAGQYQNGVRGSLQISPMMLLVLAGIAFAVMKD